MRTFEFVEGSSSKFWNITLTGPRFTVQFGKIGTAGQAQFKEFAGEEAARKEHDKLIAEKLKKGYRETTQASPVVAKEKKAGSAIDGHLAAPSVTSAGDKAVPVPSGSGSVVAFVKPTVTEGSVRTFAFSDAGSHKFWNIELRAAAFTVTYGKQGTAGTKQEKTFANEEVARKEHDKLIAEKLKKGYTETTPKPTAPLSLKEALEAALVESPDDLASHMAYADYLSEQDDPRGEFIRLQLRLEDPKLKPAERKKLAAEEDKLKRKHEKEWLGSLGEPLLDPKPHPEYEWRTLKAEWTWQRGWLSSLKIDNHTVEFCRILAHAPVARLLHRLHLGEGTYEEAGNFTPGPDVPENEGELSLFPLMKATTLGNVRELILGELVAPEDEAEGYFNCHTNGEAASGLVKVMPRLEELHLYAHQVNANDLFSLRTLPDLRVLVLYHSNSYPLGRLAKNPAMKKLEVLRFHPHAMDDEEAYIRLPGVRDLVRSTELPALRYLQLRMTDAGDKGIKEIVESGILKRLKVLDLQHGIVTDKGAEMLLNCPDTRNLERLDLTNNKLTSGTIAKLTQAGIQLIAPSQRRPDDTDEEYLFRGDIE